MLRPLMVLLVCFGVVCAAPPVQAEKVRLGWDRPVHANGKPVRGLAGYKLYYGSKRGQYHTMIPLGMKTTYTVTKLSAGQTYYFALKAYDATGRESTFSREVSITL